MCDSADICPGGDDAADLDADTVPDFCDRCAGQDDRLDADGDLVPDGCDVCDGADDAADADGDEVPDACDTCPFDAANVCLLGIVWNPDWFPVSVSLGSAGFGDLAWDGTDILAAGTNGKVLRVSYSDRTTSEILLPTTSYLLGVVALESGEIWASDSIGGVYRVPVAGPPTLVVALGVRVHSLTVAPPGFGDYGGEVLATTNTGVVTAIADDGSTRSVGSLAGASLSNAAFAPDGAFYVVNNRDDSLHTMTSGGVWTAIASGMSGADGVVLNAEGTRAYVTASNSNELYEVSLPGGATSVVSTFSINGGDNTTGMLLNGTGEIIYRASSGDLAIWSP
ncbi:MAG: hypothetical protein ACJAYU_002979 [Bradymonadia bacterium]